MAFPSRSDEDTALREASNPVSRAAVRATFHLRRYMPIYVFGTIWALMIALVPTIEHRSSPSGQVQAAGGESAGGPTAGGASGAGGEVGTAAGGTSQGAAGGTATGSGVASAAGAGAAGGRAGGGAVTAPQVGAGVTAGGVPCKPGVRQLPYSSYAAPCVAKYTGDNAGNTANGVSKDTIKVAIRAPSDANGPNAQAVARVQAQAGQVTAQQARDLANEFLPYFNKMYEMYGRHVQLVDFNGQGNGTDEAQSKGQEAACGDANNLASSQHVFGVVRFGFGYESQPFAECAKQYKLFLPLGAAYFPEPYYQRWDPYVWGGTMECERIAHDVAEYIGKRLAGKKAQYAGDTLLQNSNRKFGTYVPDNPGYGHCVDINQQDLKNKYGVDPGDRYNYALDVSQFPSEAERGIVTFNSAHDTTVVLACDPISITFLTGSARQQSYHPEWFIIGVALEDTDGYGRLYDQSEVAGHLFGMSQLGNDAKLNAKSGEAATAYKAATGKDMPSGAAVTYYNMLELFNDLQAAGPVLSAENLARGLHAMPPGGGPSGAVGTWDLSNDHTAINDSREVYYDANATGFDGKKGTYVETYGGKRFSSGQWAREDPPIYPK